MTPTEHTVEGWLLLALGAVIVLCFMDNLTGCARDWRAFRDARAMRAFLVAILLALASWTYFLGTVAAYFIPDWQDDIAGLGIVARGAYLVVGVLTVLTRRRR